MKKLISTILSLVLLLGIVAPSELSASQDKDLERLILKSKQILEVSEEYSQFEYSISKDEERTSYNFRWKNDDDTKFISASIDSEEFIMSYDKHGDEDNNQNKIPKVTQAEGKKIAEDFLKKVNPNIKDNLKYRGEEITNGISINHYYFNFTRTENNIPYANNSANVDVDNMTGQVKSYYVNWDKDMKFPKNEKIISKDKAEEIYKEKVGFELMYKYDFREKKPQPILVYSIKDKNKSIDAKTGELLDYSNNRFYGEKEDVENSIDGSKEELTKEELQAIKTAKNMLSDTQAESIAREFAKIDKSYKLSYLNMFKQEEGHRWHLDFTRQEDKKYAKARVSIDAKTKEVLNFNKYGEVDEKEKAKYNKNQSLEIAKEYLNKIQSEKSKQVEYVDIDYSQDEIVDGELLISYSFKFTRKVNGILFEGDGFDIRVDSRSGEIIGYDSSWYKGELPELNGVVSKDQAYKTFKERSKLELQYINIKISDDKKDNKNTILAYVLSNKNKLDIDAKTGTPIDLYSYGPDKENNKPMYEDIEKSIAKKQIMTLLEMGIYLPGTQFKPKDEITQRDFLYLVSKSMGGYVDYEDVDEMYKMLIGQKIVKKDEKAAEQNVTREEAVKYIIRSLNYGRVADIKDIYIIKFKDEAEISKELRGHIAIAKGLGIVNGTSDGSFRPKNKMTREQAIITIYNMLNVEK